METKNQSQNAGKVYLCPMHPEVRQPNPGKCPECHMYLVLEGTRFGMLRSIVETIVKSPLKLFIMAAVMGGDHSGDHDHDALIERFQTALLGMRRISE